MDGDIVSDYANKIGLSADPGDTYQTGFRYNKTEVHPCTYRNAPLDDQDKMKKYIENIVNRVCEHICTRNKGDGGCLTKINGKWKCSKGFPKDA
jgi:hypothetical protein